MHVLAESLLHITSRILYTPGRWCREAHANRYKTIVEGHTVLGCLHAHMWFDRDVVGERGVIRNLLTVLQ